MKLSGAEWSAVHVMSILVLAFILFVQSSWSGVAIAFFVGVIYGANFLKYIKPL